ncbi:hypothetical protein ACKKBG_A23130 [Auxenochlorella protothecoides x Auxenochlorella symbiontica]
MPKREASTLAAPARTSRSGRIVKPKVWGDGTLAAVPTLLAGGAGTDPDGEAEANSGSSGRTAGGPTASEEEAASSPREEADDGAWPRRPPAPAGPGRPPAGPEGGGIFKQAAVEVLRAERRLMSTGEIARLALARRLVRCTGKTPEATMASALYTDIKRREGRSVFIRPHEGMFGLREWIELGIGFRDDHAEDMARRVRDGYSGYLAAVPGVPPSALGLAAPGYAPGLLPGLAVAVQAAAGVARPPGAVAVPPEAGDVSGLMDLLCAAEELRRSSSPDPALGAPAAAGALAVGSGAGAGRDDEPLGPSPPATSAAARTSDAWRDAGDRLTRREGARPTTPDGAGAELRLDDPDAARDADAERPAPPPPLHAAARLAEAQVMRLEAELGPGHPAVGRAYVDLARLYTASCASCTARQLAEAALTRASEVLATCQEAQQRPPTCRDAFAYLLRPKEGPPHDVPGDVGLGRDPPGKEQWEEQDTAGTATPGGCEQLGGREGVERVEQCATLPPKQEEVTGPSS